MSDRAIAFYKRVFAWKISKAPFPLDYWLIQTGANEEPGIDGGIALRTADWQHVTMFVDVESADETANTVVRAGGAIVQPRTVIPGVGYVVACRDTEGNCFAVLQSDQIAGF
jgi:predicted enzyme related to lactoylglutathione lyase